MSRVPEPPSHPAEGLLEEITVTASYTAGRPGHFRFTPDSKTLLFLRSDGATPQMDLWSKDVKSGQERRRVSAAELLKGQQEKLSAEEKALRERQRIKSGGFTGFTMSKDGTYLILKLSGAVYRHDLKRGQTHKIRLPEGVIMDPRLSPDAKQLAFVHNHNLGIVDLSKAHQDEVVGQDRRLTTDGRAKAGHGVAEFVAAEEMDRYQGYWWAPDSQRIAYQSTDERDLETFTIADAAAPQTPAQTFGYPRPGHKNAQVKLHIVGTDGKGRTRVKWDMKRYPYLARVTWPAKGQLSILVQARDQESQVFLRVNERTGKTRLILEEKDDIWLNLSNCTPRWLSDAKSFLWATETSGAWSLQRCFVKKRKHKPDVYKTKTVVDDQAGFRSLVHVDEAHGTLWFMGGPDPVQSHLYRVPMGAGHPKRFSPDSGDHQVQFSGDGTRFVLTRSTFESAAESTIHSSKKPGARRKASAASIEMARVQSTAPAARMTPRIERVRPQKAGGFHALIIRPRNFDKTKSYPVLQYVYGGPHHNTVVENVSRYYVQQWMADHGFIVVCLDGRGTLNRGRAFERAIHEKFAEVPLEDQVKGLQALGANYPELDMDRVGVYGWSFGGYMAALCVLRRPDVYKVAVSGAPVTDWSYYDTHYTERYLGLLPKAADVYEANSLLTHAKSLQRPLLLVHGIADDNVYFAHTLKLTDALFRNRQAFQLLPLVGSTHSVADPVLRSALNHRMVQFLGAELW